MSMDMKVEEVPPTTGEENTGQVAQTGAAQQESQV